MTNFERSGAGAERFGAGAERPGAGAGANCSEAACKLSTNEL